MDIDTLRLFIQTARDNSFSQTARRLSIAPSSVSRSIDQLEQRLGVRLFQRSTRRISLTEAGNQYLTDINPLLEELAKAEANLKDQQSALRGELRITASPSFGVSILSPLLHQFRTLYPELKLHLNLTDKIVDLIDQSVDMAVRQGPLPDSTLVAERLMNSRYRICASPNYLQTYGQPTQPQQLQQHRCLVFALPQFQSNWQLRDRNGAITNIAINNGLVINNGMALKQCAIDGVGMVLLSD